MPPGSQIVMIYRLGSTVQQVAVRPGMTFAQALDEAGFELGTDERILVDNVAVEPAQTISASVNDIMIAENNKGA